MATNREQETMSDTAPLSFDLALPALTLEGGARVDPHRARGWRWGPEEGPVVLLVHALTGDAEAGGPRGWWRPVIGPGRALDPARHRLLCFNNLGSCYGTSGPADPGFPTRLDDRRFPIPAPYGKGARAEAEARLPATITSWDQARSILLALDALEIGTVHLATGGSLGGMIALCLAVLAPDRFRRVATFGATGRASPWQIGWNHVGRQLVLLDPVRGLELARQVGHMTYRAEAGLEDRQGRGMGADAALEAAGAAWSPRGAYAVETYLEHQGTRLRERFDPRAYLVQLGAMDHHDLDRHPGPPDPGETWDPDGPWGLDRIRAAILAVGIDSDRLFSPTEMAELAAALRDRGVDARYREMRSLHGHDAFLIEWGPVAGLLEEALGMPAPDQTTERGS
ncbi:MAG: alpha/beta fold hydrolase [Pseudomonadota bacterium]